MPPARQPVRLEYFDIPEFYRFYGRAPKFKKLPTNFF
jgi:hypothetical protein